MTAPDLLVAIHALATLAMTGVIWFVQVVHYPLMARIGQTEFAAFESENIRRTTLVVAPLMSVEVLTAAWLAVAPPTHGTWWVTLIGFLLLCLVWLSTAWLQVPCHRQLERGLDTGVLRRLVVTNWVRTWAWTARAMLALLLVIELG